jgi:hypothetical protein
MKLAPSIRRAIAVVVALGVIVTLVSAKRIDQQNLKQITARLLGQYQAAMNYSVR